MEYAKEVDIANDNNEYAVGNNGDNKPLAEGNNDDNDKCTSTTCCAESIILSVPPAESMMLSMHAMSIILSAPLTESMMLSAPQKDCHGSVGQSYFLYFRYVFLFAK
jgi:hypothetical protein